MVQKSEITMLDFIKPIKLGLLLSVIVFSLLTTCAYSQCDTIVIYTVADSSEQFVTIPCDTDSVSSYGEILGNVGSLGNSVALPIDSAAYPFTALSLVENDFDMLSYPIRTNVALVWADSVFEQGATCSGTLIAPNIVLTAGHCMAGIPPNPFSWKLNRYVSPSHASGFPQSQFGKTKVTHIIVLKKYYDNNNVLSNDYALLILENPIGNSLGWMGISYHQNDSILNSTMVSYNFGYPGMSGYDGKDMFYNYGIVVTNFFWSEFNNGVPGIPGQSGSSFFYVDGGKHLIYGIYVLSTTNYLFTKNRFWEIQNMIEYASTIVSVSDLPIASLKKLNVFPNPMSQTSLLTFDIKGQMSNNAFTIELYDVSGRLVMKESSINCCEYELQKGNLESGLYTVLIYNKTFMIGTSKIVIN